MNRTPPGPTTHRHEEVGQGRPSTIYSSGEYVGVLITPAEYYRLRKLSRVVAWFKTAGLDLASADEAAIAEFIRRFREGPPPPQSRPSAEGVDSCAAASVPSMPLFSRLSPA